MDRTAVIRALRSVLCTRKEIEVVKSLYSKDYRIISGDVITAHLGRDVLEALSWMWSDRPTEAVKKAARDPERAASQLRLVLDREDRYTPFTLPTRLYPALRQHGQEILAELWQGSKNYFLLETYKGLVTIRTSHYPTVYVVRYDSDGEPSSYDLIDDQARSELVFLITSLAKGALRQGDLFFKREDCYCWEGTTFDRPIKRLGRHRFSQPVLFQSTFVGIGCIKIDSSTELRHPAHPTLLLPTGTYHVYRTPRVERRSGYAD